MSPNASDKTTRVYTGCPAFTVALIMRLVDRKLISFPSRLDSLIPRLRILIGNWRILPRDFAPRDSRLNLRDEIVLSD